MVRSLPLPQLISTSSTQTPFKNFFFLKMASSSHYHYHINNDDDDVFESVFDDFLEIPDTIPKPNEKKKRIFIERNREET